MVHELRILSLLISQNCSMILLLLLQSLTLYDSVTQITMTSLRLRFDDKVYNLFQVYIREKQHAIV